MIDTIMATELIERIGDHFPNWAAKLTPERMANLAEDWAMILADLEPGTVRAAIAVLLSEPRDFPPSVGHVNAKARELSARANGRQELEAGEAWRAVCNAVESYGNGAAWIADRKAALPPAAVRAAEAFGLMRIRGRLTAEEGTDFAQFRDIYQAIAARTRQDAQMPPAVREHIARLAASLDANHKRLPEGER